MTAGRLSRHLRRLACDDRGEYAIEMMLVFPVLFVMLMFMYYTASYQAARLDLVTTADRIASAAIHSESALVAQTGLESANWVGYGSCDPAIVVTPPAGGTPYTSDWAVIPAQIVAIEVQCTAERHFVLGGLNPSESPPYSTGTPYHPLLSCAASRSASDC